MYGATPLLGTPLRVLSSPTRVVGVSTGLNDDEVVVTQQAQGVAVYNVTTRARVAAWALPAGVRLTHAAQAHAPSRRYVVVRDHTCLLGWDEADEAIDAEAGVVFDQPIVAVLQAAALRDCVAVVPIDGSALMLRAAIGSASRPASAAAVATVAAADGDDLAMWASLAPLPSAVARTPLPLCLLVLSRSTAGALTLCIRALEPHLGGAGAAPLASVGVLPARVLELGCPPPAAPPFAIVGSALADVGASGGRSKRGGTKGQNGGAAHSAQPYVSGCCVVPVVGAGGRDATLTLLWSTGQLQLWTVPPPLERGSPASASKPTPAVPRCSRSLQGIAPPPPLASASASEAPPPPSALLALGSAPLLLLLAPGTEARSGAGARTPPALSLTPRLEPRAWPELASADKASAEPQPMSLASSPALGPASGSGRVVLQLWDARFGMLHAHRRDGAEELPPGSRGGVRGAALVGGGRSVAVAFDDAVIYFGVPPPHAPFGLVHALNAAVRTAEALIPDEAAALTRAPLCAAPHVSSVLSDPAVNSAATVNDGAAGKDKAAKKAVAGVAAAAVSANGGSCSASAPAAALSAARRPVAVAASELLGWRQGVLSGAQREAGVLKRLLAPVTDAHAFESTLGDFLAVLAEEAAARAAAEEGHAANSGAAVAASGNGKRKRGKRGGDDGAAVGAGAEEPVNGHKRGGKRAASLGATSLAASSPGSANAGVRAGKSLVAALDGESQPSDGASRAGAGCARGALSVSAGFVGAVCERCVSEGSPEWLRLLRPLIEAGMLPSGSAQEPRLIAALCGESQLELLLLYVRQAPDLDASNLLMLLRLSLAKRASSGHAKPSPGEKKSGWDALLDLLICAPRNDVFLLQALRWLSLADALLLLTRLMGLFSSYSGAWRLSDGARLDESWNTPTIAQLVGWTNVLLDAHASQLLMHAPAHAPLRSLGALARTHVQLCTAMKGLKGYLGQATSKTQQPARPIADYSVELLEM